ncbi:MAG: DMT family transporter [Promethearchaeota archaeon]
MKTHRIQLILIFLDFYISIVQSENLKKGLIFGTIGVVFVGLQPIVAILRPSAMDAYQFAAMTCLIETILFFPLMLIEIKKRDSNKKNEVDDVKLGNSILKGWKNNFWLLIFIGIIFGINQIFFFIGYDLAGAINGSLTQKTTVFFSLIFGYLILSEKITKLQIIFSFILFLGLSIGITQFFSLFEINITILYGVLILLLISCLWMLGHTMTKPIFNRNEVTPIQMVFLRNILSGFILILTYLIFFPIENFKVLFDFDNQVSFILMGAVYGSGLFCWYKTLSYLDVSKASVVFSPTPVTSAIFATIILGEVFTIAHLVGIILVIVSIIIIVRQKRS